MGSVIRYRPVLLLAILLSMASTSLAANSACVISGRGFFRIHVDSAGLFAAFGHNHVIEAQKIVGCAEIDGQNITRSSIKLDFPTADIRVLDPKESAEDGAKVQKTMEAEVLRISEYPRVRFESTSFETAEAPNRLRVRGNLSIRGKVQPVVIPLAVTQSGDGTYRATGEYRFKQTMFGIEPIRLIGGAVKVKDEVRAEFELFLK